LVAGRDWLHCATGSSLKALVADWSQAGIGYTFISSDQAKADVADWSQAGIGYTQ